MKVGGKERRGKNYSGTFQFTLYKASKLKKISILLLELTQVIDNLVVQLR